MNTKHFILLFMFLLINTNDEIDLSCPNCISMSKDYDYEENQEGLKANEMPNDRSQQTDSDSFFTKSESQIKKGKSLKVLCRQFRDKLPNLISQQLIMLQKSKDFKGKSFEQVNWILNYIKNASSQDKQIEKEWVLAKQHIMSLVNENKEYLSSLIADNKINTVYISTIKWRVAKSLLNLFHMKGIQYAPLKTIEDPISTVCNCLSNYITELIENIEGKLVRDVKKFNTISTSLITLFQTMDNLIPVFQSKHIDISEQKAYFKQILEIKFNELYEVLRDSLSERRVKQSKKYLSILGKYKTKKVNKFMDNKLKRKFRIFSSKFKKLIKSLPKQVKQLFEQQNYIELKNLLKQLEQGSLQTYHNKFINSICRMVEDKYVQLIRDFSNLKVRDDVDLTSLTKNIKKFYSYSQIEDLIGNETDYRNKRDQIKINFIDWFNATLQDVVRNIRDEKFEDIKEKIKKFYQIASIYLLLGLPSQDFMVNVRKQYLEKKIQRMVLTEDTDFFQQFDTYAKLKIIDKQYSTDFSSDFKKRLIKNITSICQNMQQEAKMAEKTREIDNILVKLKNLKDTLTEQVKILPEIGGILKLVEQTYEKISNFNNISVNKNSRYQKQYLERLRLQDVQKFTVIIKQLKQQFVNEATIISAQVDKFDLDKIFQGIQILDKYKQLGKYIIVDQFDSPNKYRQKVLEKVQAQNKRLWTKVRMQLEDGKLQNYTDLKRLMHIQIASKGIVCTQILENFHNSIVNYLKLKIPDLPSSATLKAQLNRVQMLRKQEELIKIVRQYISSLSEVYTISEYTTISRYLSSLKFADQSEKQIIDKIKKLPNNIQVSWNQSNYREISNKLAEVKKVGIPLSDKAFQELTLKVKNMMRQNYDKLQKKILERDFSTMNTELVGMRNAEQELKIILSLKQEEMWHKVVVKDIFKIIDEQILEEALQNIEADMEKTFQKIIQLKEWVDKIPNFEDKIEDRIKSLILQIKQKNQIGRFVGLLQERVQKSAESSTFDSSATLCNQILHKYSKQLQIPRILPKIRIRIKDAINKFNISSSDEKSKVRLQQAYELYEQEFDQSKEKYISKGNKNTTKSNLKKIKQQIYYIISKTYDSQGFKTNIPKVLANIFVYWSLSKSGQNFYEMRKQNKLNSGDYLLQPHPIQVLSILKFIGLDQDIMKSTQKFNIKILNNHVMQIKTGEGKSVILASMAILLALMGNQVDCVSYSTYLSQRDYSDFQQIFEELGVSKKISYGTFNQITEKLINQKCHVRQLVDNLFMPDTHPITQTKKSKQKTYYFSRILLVDEIDTFFSRDFYGATYNPVSLLRNSDISEIIYIIWNNRYLNNLDIKNKYKNSTPYQKLAKIYKDCINKIDLQFSFMIEDVKNFDSRDYVIQNGRVGYKQLDGLSFKSVYGYQTMFTYIYESQQERGNINKTVAEQFIGVTITCGQFSYAQMISNFNKIFGVTGTLESLSSFEQGILKKYNITEKTFAPSVYGDSLRVQLPILIENDKSSHYQKIATVIDEELNNQRALLIFFENENQLMDFSKSEYVERFREQLKIVTEKTENRNYHIKKATSSSTVTLFTAPFGRGTDFVIFDPIVQKEGTAVIQTFLSEEESEEYQIKGRTARQGKKGTYQMILNLQKLESKFKITKQMINKAKEDSSDSISKLFRRSRAIYLEEANEQRQKQVERSQNLHAFSLQMKEKLLKKQASRGQDFFFQNRAITIGGKVRILIMIDSTSSMTNTLNQVKGKVMNMIDALAYKYPGQFQIQIMLYYGFLAYSSQQPVGASWNYNNRIHASEWTSDTSVLRKFMETVSAGGGNNHEAIQVALHHLIMSNNEVGISKGILIGDDGLADNSGSQIVYQVHPADKHRYYDGIGVRTLKIGELLSQLESQKIPIDTYPIGGGRTWTTFNEISKRTEGKSKNFNPLVDNLSVEIEATITELIVMRR